jgi:hypothetical protein
MVSLHVLVSICSHGGACGGLSAFWVELRRAKFSPGLQRVEDEEGCC